MPRKRTPRAVKGSIYVRNNILWIRLGKVRRSADVYDTPEGWQIAEEKLALLHREISGLAIKSQRSIMTYSEAWAEFVRCAVNRSRNTIINYKSAFAKITKGNETMVLTTRSLENDIIRFVNDCDVNKVSMRTYLTGIRVFVNWAAKRGYIDKIDVSSYMPRRVTNQATSFSKSEAEFIIKYLRENRRNKIVLIILLMLETGARVIDALTLEWSQVNLSKKTITWRNKITKEPEPRPCSEYTVKILEVCKKIKNTDNNLVFNSKYPMPRAMRRWLIRALNALHGGEIKNGHHDNNRNKELDNRSFQEFRVTFRMRMARRGMPEAMISWLMRHSDARLIATNYTNYAEVRRFLDVVEEDY